jgi:hypothetical protein
MSDTGQTEQTGSTAIEPPLISINKDKPETNSNNLNKPIIPGNKPKGNPSDRMQEMMRQNKALKDERRTQVTFK